MRIIPSFLWKRMTRIISPQSKILNIWHFLPKEEGKRFSVYNSTKTQMAESGGSLSENFLRQFRDKVTCMLMSDEKHNDDDDDGNDESFYKSTFKVNLWIHSIFPDIWSDFFDLLFVPNVYFNVPLQKYKIWPQNIPAWTVSWPHDPACEVWRLWPSDHDDDGRFFSMHKHFIPYKEKGQTEFWLHTVRIMTMMMDLMTMTHLSSQDSRELTQLSAVQFMEVSALLATWRRFKSFWFSW